MLAVGGGGTGSGTVLGGSSCLIGCIGSLSHNESRRELFPVDIDVLGLSLSVWFVMCCFSSGDLDATSSIDGKAPLK